MNLNKNKLPFQSLWWERRAFPLKDEDQVALPGHGEGQEHPGRPRAAFRGDVSGTSAPESGHQATSQLDAMPEYSAFGLGLSQVKNNR